MSRPADPSRDPGLAGTVLWCHPDGRVLSCVHDGLDIGLKAGDPLGALIPTGQAPHLLASAAAGGDDHPTILTGTFNAGHGSLAMVAGLVPRVAPVTAHVLVVVAQEASTATSLLRLLQDVVDGPRDTSAMARGDHTMTSTTGVTPALLGDRGTSPDDDHAQLLEAFTETNNALMALHRDLAKQGRELTEANQHLQETLATVAHDLRNPLGVISGLAATLRRDITGVQGAGSDQLLERIEVQSQRMLELVEDLLDAAVIERGVLSLDLEPVELDSLLDDVVPAHTEAAKRKDITLNLDLAAGPDRVRIDRVRFGQVLDNLLSNAVKFTEPDRGAVVTVRAGVTGDRWYLAVSDQGVGIAPERIDQLFDPFRGAGTLGTEGEPTTGLGLAISRSVVTAHGGRITAENNPDGGSTFTVTLPLR